LFLKQSWEEKRYYGEELDSSKKKSPKKKGKKGIFGKQVAENTMEGGILKKYALNS